MKKVKLSIVEKHLIRRAFLFCLLQIVMVALFIYCVQVSRPAESEDIQQTEIIVDDTRFFDLYRNDQLFLYSGSDRYVFYRSHTRDDFSPSELYKTIDVGDKLYLSYIEHPHIFLLKINLIVEARTATETYRTLEAYNRSKQELIYVVIIVGILFEAAFIGWVWFCVWIDKKKIQELFKKLKKSRVKK